MTCAACRAICLGASLLLWFIPAPASGFVSQAVQSASAPQESQPDVSSLRAQAIGEGEAGKTADAIRDYQRVLALQPDWKEGWWNLGMLEYSQKQFRDAQTAFQKEADLSPGVGIVWALLGLSEYETSDFEPARQHLEQARKLGIADDEEIARVASYHLGLLCVWSGRFERASDLLRASFGAGAMPPQVRLALGLATLHIPLLPQQLDPSREALVSAAGNAAASGDLEQFADLVKTHPDAPNLHLAYGQMLAGKGRTEDALEQFRAEEAISPENPAPWMEATRILIAQRNGTGAIKSAKNALRLAANDPAEHQLLAEALEAAGEPEKAGSERKFASTLPSLQIQPDLGVRKYYANAEFRKASPAAAPDQGEWDEARRAYMAADYPKAAAKLEAWLAANPSNGTGWALLGLCEFALHDYDNALIHLDRSARLGMSASTESLDQARYAYGVLLVRAGRFDEADSILATAWRPSGAFTAKVEFAMGLSLLRRPILPDAVEVGDTDLIRAAGRISTLLQQSRYDEAFPLFKTLLQRYPATPFLHYAYGTALVAVSDFDLAARQIQAERTISPASELPCLRLASISLRQHTPEQAIEWAKCAVGLNHDSAEAHYLFGRALLESGDATAAIQELEVAGKLSPSSPEIHFNLAKAYAKADMPEKARTERETFTRLSQEQGSSEKKPQNP